MTIVKYTRRSMKEKKKKKFLTIKFGSTFFQMHIRNEFVSLFLISV